MNHQQIVNNLRTQHEGVKAYAEFTTAAEYIVHVVVADEYNTQRLDIMTAFSSILQTELQASLQQTRFVQLMRLKSDVDLELSVAETFDYDVSAALVRAISWTLYFNLSDYTGGAQTPAAVLFTQLQKITDGEELEHIDFETLVTILMKQGDS